jgi:hypothetical protein
VVLAAALQHKEMLALELLDKALLVAHSMVVTQRHTLVAVVAVQVAQELLVVMCRVLVVLVLTGNHLVLFTLAVAVVVITTAVQEGQVVLVAVERVVQA